MSEYDVKKYYLLNEKYTSLVDVAAHPIECGIAKIVHNGLDLAG